MSVCADAYARHRWSLMGLTGWWICRERVQVVGLAVDSRLASRSVHMVCWHKMHPGAKDRAQVFGGEGKGARRNPRRWTRRWD